MKSKSLVCLLRIIFALFSLIFIKDAFYKWDGYSFYLKLLEVLPDFSLAFILWSIFGLVFAFLFWLLIFLSFKVLSSVVKPVSFEHVMIGYIILFFLIYLKILSGVSIGWISDSIGIRKFVFLFLSCLIVFAVVWLLQGLIKKYSEKVFLKINELLTPLIWIFGILLIISVPFSISSFSREIPGVAVSSAEDKQVVTSNEKRPNIIFATMDAFSATDMSLHGYGRPTTPFFEKWARGAIWFKRAYSSSNWTPPTTMTMMTGQRPWTHKNWFISYMYPFKRYENNMPKQLKDNGYATYAFIQNFNAHPDSHGIEADFMVTDKYYKFFSRPAGFEGRLYNFINYFEELVNSRIAIKWVVKHPVFTPVWLIYPSDIKVTHTPPENVYNKFLEYIKENQKEPFFAWLHLEAPHYVFLPPEPYIGMFGDEESYNTSDKQMNNFSFNNPYEEEKQDSVNVLKKRQDEYILYADQQFKIFLSKLGEAIDMSNTVLIMSADHGTSVKRGYIGHNSFRLYEEITNIPLIIKMPDSDDYKNGSEVDFPVEQVDIAPTILNIAGIKIPEWMEGRSLLPLLEGRYIEPKPVFSMELGKNRAIDDSPLTQFSIAVWEDKYKLIYYKGWEGKETELFDLKSDPGETINIINDKPAIATKLLKLIESNLSDAMKKTYKLQG